MNILIVEDDKQIASYLQKGLEEESFVVDIAHDGTEGLASIREKNFDVIILDWMLPKLSGIDICTIVKKNDINTPILMLSAKSSIQDKVDGLNCGADDYLSKPFSFDELVARVNALIRRKKLQNDSVLRVANLSFDIYKREVSRDGKIIGLTTKEYDFLELLMKNKGHVVSTKKITSNLWGDETISSNIIKVLIHHLRNKLDEGYSKTLIKTVRKIGYKIDDI
ncbi:MAG: response regulator transcription factor [Sulfurospirillum sp.]